MIKVGGNRFHIATLEKDKVEDKTLDLFFGNTEEVTFEVKGKGELHILGYMEPLVESDDDD